MAYNEELDRMVSDASEALRTRYAENPVIANAGRRADGVISDPTQLLGFGVPTGGSLDLNATSSYPTLSERIDANTAALRAARDATPVVDESAKRVRDGTNVPATGPISEAASKVSADFQSVPVPQRTQDLVRSAERVAGAPLSVVPGNPNYKAEYAIMRAREAQAQQDFDAARTAQLNFDNQRATAFEAQQRADNAARGVPRKALFDTLITNASTVDTGQRGGGASPLPAAGAVPAPQYPAAGAGRDLVQQAIAEQQQTQSRESGAISLETERLKLAQQKRLNDLGTQLAAATDPRQRERLSQTLLAMLGKDKPEEFQVIHAPGAESLAPDGITKLKGPDAIVVLNKRTGAREILRMGDAGSAPAAPAAIPEPKEGDRGTYRGQSVVFRDGRWQRAQ